MITSLIELLELPNFGQISTSTIQQNFVVDVSDINYDVIVFISK